MEILGRGYTKVRYTKEEIIKRFTIPTCTPWIEVELNNGIVELGCECGHCDGLAVRLINYISGDI